MHFEFLAVLLENLENETKFQKVILVGISFDHFGGLRNKKHLLTPNLAEQSL